MTALIGALRVSLSADTAAFSTGMKRAERQARTSSTAINKSLGLVKAGFAGLAAGFSIGLVTRAIGNALEYAGALGEVSQQLGVTTKDLQVFRYAAGQVGISQEQMEKGLQKLTITLGQLAAGAKAPRAALEGIRKGMADQVLQAKDTGEAFRIIADGLQQIPDRAQRAAVEVALFGRAGAQLDNLLAGGSSAINQLAQAAEELGIVLSDEQIQKADDTADKLEALKTVLAARIAGTVADNAASIYKLADSLIYLVAQAGEAITKMQAFYRTIAIEGARFVASNPTASKVLFGTKGSAAILRAGAGAIRGNIADRTPAKPQSAAAAAGGKDVGQFLAGGGGGSKRKGRDGSDDAMRKQLSALSDQFRFEEDIRRAQLDVLRAQEQLATDYSERARLAIEQLNLEKQSYEAELAYQVEAFKISKGQEGISQAQADQLKAQYDIRDGLERQAVLQEEQTRRREDYNRLEDLGFDLQRDILESELQLADTIGERRDLEMQLLDLAYRQERARLEAVIADEQSSWAAKEEARRRLEALKKTEGNDREAVERGNMTPLDEYKARYADISEENGQAFVNMLEGVSDALSKATDGLKELKESLLETFKTYFQTLLKNQLNQLFASAIPTGFGGFSVGGFTGTMGRNKIAGVVHGQEFVLNANATRRIGIPNLEAMNRGAPLAAVSNDNGTSSHASGGNIINQNFNVNTPDANSFRMSERQILRQTRRRLGT